MVLPENIDALALFGQSDPAPVAGGGDNMLDPTTPVADPTTTENPEASTNPQEVTQDPSQAASPTPVADPRDVQLAQLQQKLAEESRRRAGVDRRLTDEQQRRISAENERNLIAQQQLVMQMNELGWDSNQQQAALGAFQQQLDLQRREEAVRAGQETVGSALRQMTAIGLAAQVGIAPEEFEVLGPYATLEQMQQYAGLRKAQMDTYKAQQAQAERAQQVQQRAQSGVDKPPVKQEVSQPPKAPQTLDEAVAYLAALGRR